jgi:SAM-dependent methyltransferase
MVGEATSVRAAMLELTKSNCPLCGCPRSKFIFGARDQLYGQDDTVFNIVQCLACGMGFINPRPSEASLRHFYPPPFYQQNHQEGLQTSRNLAKLAWLEGAAGKLLDIGCAGGEFLHYARQQGWNVQGFEWSEVPRNYYNLPIVSNAGLEVFPTNSFDAITMWAVLEHILEPLEAIRQVRRILKPQGRAIFLVTNFNSVPARFMRKDDIPRHVNLFTKASLSRALRRHGLVPQRWSFDNRIFRETHLGMWLFLYK